jgi:hypothetical protein
MSEFTLTDFILAILVLAGACIGGYWSYRGSQDAIKNQLENERKNIAKIIDLDLKNIYKSIYFNIHYTYLKDVQNIDTIKNDFRYIRYNEKMYNDKTLLYNTFIQDIGKLDYTLSSEILEFYSDFFEADNYWTLVFEEKKRNTEFLSDCIAYKHDNLRHGIFDIYQNMNILIIKCGDKIPELREKLKKVYYA